MKASLIPGHRLLLGLCAIFVLSMPAGCREQPLSMRWRSDPDRRAELLPEVLAWLKAQGPVSVDEFVNLYGPYQDRESRHGGDDEYEILYHAGTYAATGFVPMDDRWVAFKVKDGLVRSGRVL